MAYFSLIVIIFIHTLYVAFFHFLSVNRIGM